MFLTVGVKQMSNDIPAKIKIVYNRKTGKIVPHSWFTDGTVALGKLTEEDEPFEEIIVSLVDPRLVDFDTDYVILERKYGTKKKDNH